MCACKLHEFTSSEAEIFRKQLLSWYDTNKRDLPWRKRAEMEGDNNVRGYAVWVSEIMLQQTQVATVIDYYNKWMKKWPSLQDLAASNLEEVNEMWAGLGYYSRARRLHEACRKVAHEMNGKIPTNAASLMKLLPGVGKYTASAIASIAFNEPVGVVDGNVIRVLSRIRVIGVDSSSALAQETFWQLVDKLLKKDRPGDFNQAMMELGATVCLSKAPQCHKCPAKDLCTAFKETKNQNKARNYGIKSFINRDANLKQEINALGDIEDLEDNCSLCLPKDSTWDSELGVCNYPRKTKPKEARQERLVVCIIELQAMGENDEKLLFTTKRPSTGLLAGLWEFPNFVIETDMSVEEHGTKAKEYLAQKFQITLTANHKLQCIGEVVHLFSHIHHTYVVHKIQLTIQPENGLVQDQTSQWVPQSKFLEMAVSTAMKKVFNLYKNGCVNKPGVKRLKNQKENKRKQRMVDSYFEKK